MRKYFRTSYLPNEILWGQRFEQMQLYRKDNNKFEINFSAFHSTYEVDTPLYSARQMYQLERQREMEIKQVNIFLQNPELNPVKLKFGLKISTSTEIVPPSPTNVTDRTRNKVPSS